MAKRKHSCEVAFHTAANKPADKGADNFLKLQCPYKNYITNCNKGEIKRQLLLITEDSLFEMSAFTWQ